MPKHSPTSRLDTVLRAEGKGEAACQTDDGTTRSLLRQPVTAIWSMLEGWLLMGPSSQPPPAVSVKVTTVVRRPAPGTSTCAWHAQQTPLSLSMLSHALASK